MVTTAKRTFPFFLIIVLLLTVALPTASATFAPTDDLLVTFPGDYPEAAG